jgi:anti-sigma B factor antagonist
MRSGLPWRRLDKRGRSVTHGGFQHLEREISRLAREMQSHFRVEVANKGEAAIISVSGELDLASSPALEEELERACSSDASLVVVDLRGLEFMDSTGLSVLVRAHQRAIESSQRFGLVNGSQQVQRLLTLTGVAERLTLADAPEELLE